MLTTENKIKKNWYQAEMDDFRLTSTLLIPARIGTAGRRV